MKRPGNLLTAGEWTLLAGIAGAAAVLIAAFLI